MRSTDPKTSMTRLPNLDKAAPSRKHRVGFGHNFATHYTKRTFELLAEACEVKFLFFSDGDVPCWPAENGVQKGSFVSEYLPGFAVAGTRIVPRLPVRLLRGNYDLIVKCVNGRYALPVTYLATRLRCLGAGRRAKGDGE